MPPTPFRHSPSSRYEKLGIMPDAPPVSKELMEAARDIAIAGGDLTLKWFQNPSLSIEIKSDGSPVTEADKAAESLIREHIHALTPGASIVGEEQGASSGSGNLTWYVDPIDGTKGFSRGVPLYSTLLAVEDEHGPAVGVIHIPATNETVWAGRGVGAFTKGGRAQVSSVSELNGAYVTTSSVSRWGCDVFTRVHNAGIDVRGWGDGYGFLMVATGRIDAMIDLGHGNPWDYAPMPVIMHEAGGTFTDRHGKPTIDSDSAVASNGHIHEALLATL